MADTGEIVAGATGLGAFLGALFGALKMFGRKQKPGNDEDVTMAVVINRLSNMERRQTEIDARLDDVFHLLEKISDALSACQMGVTTALTKLDERRADK